MPDIMYVVFCLFLFLTVDGISCVCTVLLVANDDT